MKSSRALAPLMIHNVSYASQTSGIMKQILSAIALIFAFFLFGVMTAGNYQLSILLVAVLLLAALSAVYPVEINIAILSVWGLFQGLLTNISFAGFPFSQLIIPAIVFPLAIGLIVRTKTILESKCSQIVLIYVLWTVWNVAGIATTIYVNEAVLFYFRFVIGAALFAFFALGTNNLQETNRIAKALVFCGTLSAIITVAQFVSFQMFGLKSIGIVELVRHFYGDAYRPVGTFDGPVGSANVLFAMYLVSSYKYLQTRNRIYLAAGMFMIAGMLVTLTRTVALALILSVVFQAVHASVLNKRWGPIIKISALIMIVAALLSQFAADIIAKRFVDILGSASIDSFGAGRVGIWIGIVKGFIQEANVWNYFIGRGISIAKYFVFNYSAYNHGDGDYTHNDFLDIAISNGIISLFLLVLFIGKVFQLLSASARTVKLSFFFPLVFYFSVIMALSNTNYSSGQRWFFLIVLALIINQLRFDSVGRSPEKLETN
ncbi:MAG TPA: O-antigen ligase family protein [Bacilli bacterium]